MFYLTQPATKVTKYLSSWLSFVQILVTVYAPILTRFAPEIHSYGIFMEKSEVLHLLEGPV